MAGFTEMESGDGERGKTGNKKVLWFFRSHPVGNRVLSVVHSVSYFCPSFSRNKIAVTIMTNAMRGDNRGLWNDTAGSGWSQKVSSWKGNTLSGLVLRPLRGISSLL